MQIHWGHLTIHVHAIADVGIIDIFIALHSSPKTSPTKSIVNLSEGSLTNGNGWGAEGSLVNVVPGLSSLMNPSIYPSTPAVTLPSRLQTFSSTNCLGNISKVNSSNPSQLSADNTKANRFPLLVAP